MLKNLFSSKSSKKETRLRHVLYVGAMVERKAEEFYRRLAQQAKNADGKEFYLRLADDEARHFRFIDNILSGWQSLPVSRNDLEAMDAGAKVRSLFSDPPHPEASLKEITDYAMDAEKKMVAFYLGFEKEFTDEWKKMKLWDMIEEEKSHVKKLADMLFLLRDSKKITE